MFSHRFRIILAASLYVLTGILGHVFEMFYFRTENRTVPIEQFKNDWHEKELYTQKTLNNLAVWVENNQTDKLHLYDDFSDEDIGFYLYKNDTLVFWSNNQMQIHSMKKPENDTFCTIGNAFCVQKTQEIGNYTLLGLIKIKNNFPITNSYVENSFAKGLHISSGLNLETSTPESPFAVVSTDGNYLFSLAANNEIPTETTIFYLSHNFWWLCVASFFLLFYFIGIWICEQKRPVTKYLALVAVVTAIIITVLQLGIPSLLFETSIFSPIYYTSSTLIESLGHLFIITALYCVAISIYYFHAPQRPIGTKKRQLLLGNAVAQAVSIAIFSLIVWLLYDLNTNSSIELSLYSIDNFSLITLVTYVVIACWILAFIMLRIKFVVIFRNAIAFRWWVAQNIVLSLVAAGVLMLAQQTFLSYTFLWYAPLCFMIDKSNYVSRKTYLQLAITVVILSHFVAWFVFCQQEQKRAGKYRVIAENIMLSEIGTFDVSREILLEDIENEIKNDVNILRYFAHVGLPISKEQMVEYLTKKYFKNSWDVYTIDVQMLAKSDESNNRILKQIKEGSLKKYHTNYFYCNHKKDNLYDYMGVFPYSYRNDTTMLYIKMTRKEKTPAGYANIVFEKNKNGLNKNIASAIYEGAVLKWKWGKYDYPTYYDFKPNTNVIYLNGYKHFIFPFPNNEYVVVSEKRPSNLAAYWIFWTYLFAFYFAMAFVGNAALLRKERIKKDGGFFARIRLNFVVYLIISLAVVFAVAVGFIYAQFADLQETNLLNTAKHIKKELKPFIAENDINIRSATNDYKTQDLARMYETDIILYNSKGIMVSTSAPYLFNAGFASELIHPTPFWGQKSQEFIQNEHIGTFHFPVVYTAIVDDNEIKAYICLPTFAGLNELRDNTFVLLAIFMNIYLLFIILSAIAGISLSKQLSRPLKTIKERMQAIKLGSENEKIDYRFTNNDELGLLVVQYNQMVDKLTESVELLAQQERELAWREMARQIAHEIKNPLTPMKLTIQQLQRSKMQNSDQFDESFKKTTSVLIEQIENLSRIATEFSNFARMPETHLAQMDIAEKLVTIVNLFNNNNNDQAEIIYRSTIENALIMADSAQMTQLFNNLLKNAIQSIPPDKKGKIIVELEENETKIIVSISDNGTGIPAEIQPKLFLPDFTTKSSGMGLGLCIVKNIVTASHGEITFTTKENVGTKFIITFPKIS